MTAQAMADASCTSCGGALVSRKRYRMSPAIVAVGYCGLVMSALAIFASLVMVFFGIDRLQAMFLEEMAAPRIEVLHVAGVPEGVIRKVAGAEAVTAAERQGLTGRQLRLIADAQQYVEATRAAAATAGATARLHSLVVAVFCAVTGGLSLLLLARGDVRWCADCGAVICTARGTP
jgi:hypothetical protein